MMIKKFIKEIGIFLLASGLSRFLPFLLTPLFTHYIPVNDMGALEVILSIYNIIIIFGMMQMDASMQRYFYENEDVIPASLLLVTAFSLIAMFLVSIFSHFLSIMMFNNGNYTYHIKITALMILVVNVFTISTLVTRYKKGAWSVAAISAVQATSFALLALYLIIYKRMGSLGYITASLMSYVPPTIWALVLLRKDLKTKLTKPTFRKLWRFSWPQFPARIASAFTQYGNRFIILLLFSQASVGVFALASKIASLMFVLLSAFNMVWYPILYKNVKDGKNTNGMDKIFNGVLFFLPLFAIAFYATSYILYNYYIAPSYKEGLPLSYFLIFSVSVLFVKEMVDAGIKIKEKSHYISIIYINSLIFFIASAFILAKMWGLIGIALAAVATNIFMTLYSWYISERLMKMGFKLKYFITFVAVMFAVTIAALRLN
ncbi:hypothetical protein B1H58_14555 [Pantoea alhagi]|uniref:Polysaccharide biosynthesis protein n=1 Tax=Pantoea alhagi TaxID=1891675 RepID=A0A1W6B7R5_9GAMM|nr:lipopolysaccharide biosynthesis protein [Pantoea alhagi]ARJ43130.1 hypothetical protein B1H58_14555 [Pantoea alhagi]